MQSSIAIVANRRDIRRFWETNEMKTCVHPNSITAYHGINLSRRHAEIVKVLKFMGEATDAQIATRLGYTTNRVTGRISELTKNGVVVECGTATSEFGKPNRINRLRRFDERLF